MRSLSIVGLGLVLMLGGCKQAPEQAQGGDAGGSVKLGAVPEPVQDEASLGARSSSQCAELGRTFAGLDALPESFEPSEFTARLGGSLDWVTQSDLNLGRTSEGQAQDRALIEQVLAGMSAHDQAARQVDRWLVTTQLRVVALLEMRRLLGEVADDRLRGSEAVAAWDEAYCIWNAGLRPLAARVDALQRPGAGQAWVSSIPAAFTEGRAQLGGAGEPADPTAVKAAKQQIEKGMYAVAYQLILAQAESRSAIGATEALGLIDALEDRLADRNGPGLKRMRMMLNGPADQIDAKLIERELAVAFAKRARKYCDKAVVSAELATPEAIAETWEGVIYTRVILGSMGEALGPVGFDAVAHGVDWEDYLEAVETGDAELAAEISVRLVEWNCAYQRHLGIAECASSTNEVE
ncbi:hypothetical protein DB30_03563 [Enhygromyxa salina]|uniref:Uncharacterized protein n=1 Tax=Enhygromyxa salina TaxID=215803 RepID=A0A0C2D6J3_9BACT|nr:hypothetical protein [Enhygromyxa salina]KIG17250.1 hypothetical protein DB30_03563 [Enhygromyxa salina]